MNLKSVVRKAAVDKNISGVMKLKDLCGLSYERTVRVWNGCETAKFSDVKVVLKSLGLEMSAVKSQVKEG
tara:strand:+ start:263 stop:472 length:210 start_codon:yes stop_codon:yes gene_type:complete